MFHDLSFGCYGFGLVLGFGCIILALLVFFSIKGRGRDAYSTKEWIGAGYWLAVWQLSNKQAYDFFNPYIYSAGKTGLVFITGGWVEPWKDDRSMLLVEEIT
ncbi:hypothetical protein EYC84_003452 [Monilinia fructicola]|uniref:Uncharacterized protein n=1 Tax=Monilinia fructicola TaxID=38448 RepID=A0A5M9JTN8_MONFR|nr:hypothetical protein EYC84_003452 [Monilinia fructicola]